ncbi:MAG: sulfotransferase domain-containing protein [archaeon]
MKSSEFKNLILIPGAQKSGTTTLFDILSKHSMIETPYIKESQFFALEERTIKKNIEWYKNFCLSRNEDDEKHSIDASTFYLYSDRTPSLIKKFMSDIKILIILRNPIKRAFSAYLHWFKKIPCADKRTFTEIINSIEGPTFNKIIETENKNIRKAIENNKINENYLNEYYLSNRIESIDFPSNFEDPLFVYKYVQNSLYRIHIDRFKELFDEIKIIFLEEFIDETVKVMKDVLDFLELEYEDSLSNLPHKNKTKVPRNKLARVLLNLNKRFVPIPVSTKISWQMKDKSILYTPRPKLSKELYEKGRSILKKEYDYWISEYPKLEEYWSY